MGRRYKNIDRDQKDLVDYRRLPDSPSAAQWITDKEVAPTVSGLSQAKRGGAFQGGSTSVLGYTAMPGAVVSAGGFTGDFSDGCGADDGGG